MHVMSQAQKYRKYYIQQMELLHYIDFVRDNTIWTLLCVTVLCVTSLWSAYITIIKHIFGKLNSFLQTYVIW